MVRVYLHVVSRVGPNGVEFHAPGPVVLMMWPVETLSDLKKTVLRNMRLPKRTLIIRVTYRFFVLLPDISCRYKVFWLSNDKHVQAMFARHGRILADQLMDLCVQILDTWTAMPGSGPSNPAPKVEAPMTANSLDVVPPDEHIGETKSVGEDPGDTEGGRSGSGNNEFVSTTPVGTRFLLLAPLPVPDLSTVDSNYHTLDLDAMEDDRMTDTGGGGDNYNLDGGRVTSRTQGGEKVCQAARVHGTTDAQLDITVIVGYIMHIIKKIMAVRIEVLREVVQESYHFRPSYRMA
ncbi:hypothetical protein PIB30_003496 [Stylosanthes scabra]|uniref:Uncharacterized protein n=1 Tax=Stylosanthes scabra TaxID=79078 RepID=A0ABU6V2E7_9FABA|nr:hypothetical protein [Stylosanthes scabra]